MTNYYDEQITRAGATLARLENEVIANGRAIIDALQRGDRGAARELGHYQAKVLGSQIDAAWAEFIRLEDLPKTEN